MIQIQILELENHPNSTLDPDIYKVDGLTDETGYVQNYLCESLVAWDLAHVSVMFESPTYVRSVKDRRVSFTDKVSSIGD